MRRADALREQRVERVLQALPPVALRELLAAHELEDLLELGQDQHLLGAAAPRPEPDDALQDGDGRVRVLLHVLHDAVAELLVVEAHALGLVQRDERALQEHEVLLLQRDCEAVDDGPQDLQQLADPVVALRLVDEAVEHVGDGLADEGAVRHELAVDAVQDGLEVVALARVLRVEELDEVQAEGLVHVALGHLGVDLLGHDEAQEELVDHLQVRPRRLHHGLVLIRVELLELRRQRPEDVRGHARHDVRHERLGEHLLPHGGVHEVHQLQQRLPLQVLLRLVLLRVPREAEDHRAELQLLLK
mmetsp:Transcript_13315/g.39612  ORF Transcript_13315/g.39612 Transcript_13315/m.39612 type:complete len:303 (+) Transcript_13315:741-1649(+)